MYKNGRDENFYGLWWFGIVPEIPISLGPTRYSGLPGLILELHENEIGYIVDKIDFVSLPKKNSRTKIGEILDDEEINLRDQNVKNEMLNSK